MTLIKAISKTAPANIAVQDFLFFGCGKAFFILDALQAPYCCNIGGVLFAWCSKAQLIVCNTEVMALIPGYLRVQSRKDNTLPFWFRGSKFRRLCYGWFFLCRHRFLLCSFGICHDLSYKRVIV